MVNLENDEHDRRRNALTGWRIATKSANSLELVDLLVVVDLSLVGDLSLVDDLSLMFDLSIGEESVGGAKCWSNVRSPRTALVLKRSQ